MYGFRFQQLPNARWSYVRQLNGVDLPTSWQCRDIYNTFRDYDGARAAGLEWVQAATARAAERFQPCPNRTWHHVGSTCAMCEMVD